MSTNPFVTAHTHTHTNPLIGAFTEQPTHTNQTVSFIRLLRCVVSARAARARTQIDYIRRRQHISTIDTNSPTRGLLSQGTPPSQTYVPTGVGSGNGGGNVGGSLVGGMPQLHGGSGGGHNPMGYCTLRNGSKQATNHSMVSAAHPSTAQAAAAAAGV